MFKVKVDDITVMYVTAYGCAGRLKNKFDIRLGFGTYVVLYECQKAKLLWNVSSIKIHKIYYKSSYKNFTVEDVV